MSGADDMAMHPSDDLAAYALGALEPKEEATVRTHVDSCERCRAELQWLRPAVDVLPASVPQLEPPRRLRSELMKTVRADARAERGGWWSRRAGWITMRARPALAVGAIALLGAGIAGYAVNAANQAGEQVLTQLPLEPSPSVPAASGMLERSGAEASLTVAGMPPLEGSRVYQLWYDEDGELVPATSFRPGQDGSADTDLGELPPQADQVLVTEESEPGLPEPRGEVLLSAPLT